MSSPSAKEVPFSMYNAFFIALLVSSVVFYLSLLTVKSANLVVACDGFFFDNRHHLQLLYSLTTKMFFEQFLISNGLKIADNKM